MSAKTGKLFDEIDRIFRERNDELDREYSEHLWTAHYIDEVHPGARPAKLERHEDEARKKAEIVASRQLELVSIWGRIQAAVARFQHEQHKAELEAAA